MILQGRHLIIKSNGTAIAAAKSCSIDIKAKKQEVSSPLTGTWETYIAGRKSWVVSVSGLILADPTDLPQHLSMLKSWVGTSMTLTVSIAPNDLLYPGLLPFDGMIEDVSVSSTTLNQRPTKIFWDDITGKFVGLYNNAYYTSWTGGTSYMSPAANAYFYSADGIYQIQNNWLTQLTVYDIFTGTALCESIKPSGSIGGLATYAAQFQGSGELADTT